MRRSPTAPAILVLLVAFTACVPSGRFDPNGRRVHRTDQLVITRITDNSFIHTSYHQTDDLGNVPCNGLVVRDGKEVVIFDTPTKDASAEELIAWVQDDLHCTIKAIVPTHFHVDCLGGLQAFHAHDIPSYAHARTLELSGSRGTTVPRTGFTDTLILVVGSEQVVVRHFGEGHTVDNVVGYFAKEEVLFGGCLIKELNATKGYLGDANEAAWSSTVERVKAAHPRVRTVVPGHGQHGDQRLLDYTIALFHAP